MNIIPTEDEKREVITICDNLARLKFSHHLPYVFTEHGVAMLSSVLKSDRAVEMNINEPERALDFTFRGL